MDVGCTSDNFQRLLEVGRAIDAQDKLFGFRYYHDPGYEEPAFSFYLRSDPNVLCDICEYRQEGGRLVCAAESWHYPSHAVDDVMPLRRVTLLGQSAFVPARAAAMPFSPDWHVTVIAISHSLRKALTSIFAMSSDMLPGEKPMTSSMARGGGVFTARRSLPA